MQTDCVKCLYCPVCTGSERDKRLGKAYKLGFCADYDFDERYANLNPRQVYHDERTLEDE